MPSIKDIIHSGSALQEMGLLAKGIVNIMTDPSTSREDKRKTLNSLVNELSEKSFQNGLVADQIMIIINMKQEECEKFEDTNAQVAEILSWLPRMEFHKKRLNDKVSKSRKSYGLKL